MSPKATLIIHDKQTDNLGNSVEIKLWSVPPDQERKHGVKYSLVYIVQDQRVIGYDNERGKGDHKHIDGTEFPYLFVSPRQLKVDFLADVALWKEKNHDHQS
jgi:Family of unknown function (DUF6516)